MSAAEAFFDTNVLLYLLSADGRKADRAEAVMTSGGVISVQVLNEFAAVAARKLRMNWAEIGDVLTQVRAICRAVPLTSETHDAALRLAARRQLSIYDACIVASALEAGCSILYSEDMQHGQVFDRRLRVVNPFRA
jgi:predicted nucleic acid-binding protein